MTSSSPSFVFSVTRVLVLAVTPLIALEAAATVLRLPLLSATAVAFAVATASIVTGTGTAPHSALSSFRTAFGSALAAFALMIFGFGISRLSKGSVGPEICSGLMGSAGVILLGSTIGSLVGRRISDPGHLIAVALASSAADIWSVYAPEGITHDLISTPDVALQRLLAVSAALPPSRIPVAVFGIGDVIFAALYAAAASRHALPRVRMLGAVATGLLLAGAAVLVTQRPLPALPFVGTIVVLAQPRVWKIAKRDRFPTMTALVLLLVALARVLISR